MIDDAPPGTPSITTPVGIGRDSRDRRRLEKAAIFLQITLGLAVFSDSASMKVVGAEVSISGCSGFHHFDLGFRLPPGQLDSEIPDFICRAAENAEHIYNNSLAPHPLSLVQKALVRIAGS